MPAEPFPDPLPAQGPSAHPCPMPDARLRRPPTPHARRPMGRTTAPRAQALAMLGCALMMGLATLTDASANTTGSSAKRRPATTSGPVLDYGQQAPAQRLALDMAAQHGLDPVWVQQQIAQVQRQPQAIRLIAPAPSGTPKNWIAYRARFIEPTRIQAGQEFWRTHEATLARAEAQYGVPASVIVGVIGVETLYGRHTGQFRVIDALTTLALEFPSSHPRAAARTAFFRDELGHFLVLAQQQGWDPRAPRGSFAGAMGWPQFMPSSWRRFAVDFDGDGRIDLFQSIPDVIGSVAHYLREFGWQPGLPTHYPVHLQADAIQMHTLMGPDILPTFNAQTFESHGALLEERGRQHTGKLALVELQNGEAPPQYVAGTENFYAITRYNWSSYYAMAVIELGETVQARVRSR